MLNLLMNMKRRYKVLGMLALPLLAAMAIIPSVSIGGQAVSADTTEIVNINNEAGLKAIVADYTKSYKLTGDITLSSDWVPLGTKVSAFKGTFDGNGYSIKGLKMSSNFAYQGLFGYTNGATIKNLKISYTDGATIKYNFNDSQEEYYVGAIVGYANNTKISNCEVDNGTEQVDTFNCKVTYGGLVGCLDNVSSIENCANYRDMKVSENLSKSGDTITIGGIAGTISNSSKLLNVVNFGNINITRQDDFTNTTYGGGIVGDFSGNSSQVINCVSGGNTLIDSFLEEKDSNFIGTVAGYINAPIPAKGNIANIAYAQNIEKYGKNDGYLYKNDETKDYVSRLPSEALRLSKFYFLGRGEVYKYQFDGIEETFDWHEAIGDGWSDSVWSIVVNNNVSEIRLQEFQTYTVEWANPTDNLGVLQNASRSVNGKYNTEVELTISIPAEDSVYYEITDILYNNKSCKNEYEMLNPGEALKEKDLGYYYNQLTHQFGIRIKLSSKTAGNAGDVGYYSFELKAKEFTGAVYVDSDKIAGAVVKFSEGLNKERIFTKQTNKMTASATAGSRYTFQQWNLYYKNTDPDENVWSGEGESRKLNDGYLQAYDKIWKVQGVVYDTTGTGEVKTGTIEKKLPIKFGGKIDNYVVKQGNQNFDLMLTQDFLFEAVYEEDPYYLSFSEDVNAKEGILYVKINNKEVERNDKGVLITTDIGKNENVIIEIAVGINYQLDKDRLAESIKRMAIDNKDIAKVTEKTLNDQTVYTFNFSTGLLSETKARENRYFSFDVTAKPLKTEKDNSSLGWIIGGSVGGGVVLIGLIVLIVFLARRRSFEKRKINDDYKRYYK